MKLNLTKDLVALRNNANLRIDSDAGRIRLLFISDIVGQDALYQQKIAEAKIVLETEDDVSLVNVPHIYAERDIRGTSLKEVAERILEKANEWTAISSAIEAIRLTHKQMVKDAKTPAEIEAAVQIDWSSIEARA